MALVAKNLSEMVEIALIEETKFVKGLAADPAMVAATAPATRRGPRSPAN
ncbi:MAG: hypothetical protein QM278_10360 [Pseudomonadota bacterium]|nr:hypothetical protein [Pseudomonadota bacterium]